MCAFCWVLDTLPGQCLRRRLRANPLVADAFRTKRLLGEHCSATCPRRRRPGQARHTQGGLQITAVLRARRLESDQDAGRLDVRVLRGEGQARGGGYRRDISHSCRSPVVRRRGCGLPGVVSDAAPAIAGDGLGARSGPARRPRTARPARGRWRRVRARRTRDDLAEGCEQRRSGDHGTWPIRRADMRADPPIWSAT